MSEITAPDDAAPGPTTLSGRPAVDTQPVTRTPRTKVSRPAAFFFTVFLVAVLVFAGLSFLRSGPEGTDVRDMDAGQCYTEVDTTMDGGRVIPRGENSPCMASASRVVAVVDLPLGAYPSDNFAQVVADHCGGEQQQVIAPTPETWAAGDRTVVCLVLPQQS